MLKTILAPAGWRGSAKLTLTRSKLSLVARLSARQTGGTSNVAEILAKALPTYTNMGEEVTRDVE